MPLNSTLVHPGLLASMPQFFPSRCSVYAEAAERNPLGERIPVPTDAALPGTPGPIVENVRCLITNDPSMNQIPNSNEERTSDATYSAKLFRVMLAGNYPQITEKMRAVVDGLAYDIRSVTVSGFNSHTELLVERITI